MATIPLINNDGTATGTPATLDLSYGTDMGQTYRVRRSSFGDGYSQRAAAGLNSKPQQWKLSWTRIKDADAEMLRRFFEGLAGVGIIEWAPYNQDQTKPLKWTANGWSARPSGTGIHDCSITLTQEFDL